ncbi:Alpha/Beta hydrolase protein [Podospora fimiseda]|uniref:Alpha/Beta hydrolase protein n=1 Tax=Podospora fimiseda TaxID=252190 RepID=A0AAN7BSD1_9PEZI|nr:Alpha/Beta hydrolase protein [Podospora fimiseda]
MPPFPFSPSTMFDFELIRILGSSSSSGCETTEFKSALSKIKKNDPESWNSAWKEQASRAERIGNEAASAGFRIPAKNAFLRASNYFRAAAYMFPSNDDPRILTYSEKSIKMFIRASELMDGKVMHVEIPYEGNKKLTGWLCLPSEQEKLPGKTSNCLLGYTVLCLEGPGQGMLLKRDKIPLRPDFEVVSGYSNPELDLDLDRIAVAGAATGGYFALRAATDPRTKACVAIDPFYSMWELALTCAPQSIMKLWENGCEMNLGKTSMGVDKPSAGLRRFKDFSLDTKKDGNILERITCPVFLTGPGAETVMYASADDSTYKIEKKLVNVPASKKEVWVPVDVADGGLTAKIGAWALLGQKTFIFLDKHFGVKRAAL